MGWIVLSEPVGWFQIGGMGLVMGAMWLLVKNDAPGKQGLDTSKPVDLERSEPLN
jgi:drug/metabolite transporter (DMT)-like permease